jgi:hypothetical protein
VNKVKLSITLDIEFATSFLRPHEVTMLEEITAGNGGGASRTEFKSALHAWAGPKIRDMMDARAPGRRDTGLLQGEAADKFWNFGERTYGVPNWPKAGERTVGYGHPSGHGEHHQNCRCEMNITLPGDTKALAESVRRVLGPEADIRRPHKPVTRKEAARAVRAVQKAEREQREADHKTARAQAALKGWDKRRKATRKRRRAA